MRTKNMQSVLSDLRALGFLCDGCGMCRSSYARVWKVSRGQIMADRKLYAVEVQYRHERPMTVYFNGPACGVGPVFVSFNGIDTEIVRPDRFGPFDHEYPRRFYAHVQIEPVVPDAKQVRS